MCHSRALGEDAGVRVSDQSSAALPLPHVPQRLAA
jgi:hypothetical protein